MDEPAAHSTDRSTPISNPFANHDEYNCFGCDPNNPIGLRLSFLLERTPDGDLVTTSWEPRRDLEGYPGVVHGGIQATLCDEVAAWYVYAVHGKAGVTRKLSVDYLTPARIADGPFRLTARLAGSTPKVATVEVALFDRHGTPCAKAEVEYAVFSDAIGRKRFSYPGREAFLPSIDHADTPGPPTTADT